MTRRHVGAVLVLLVALVLLVPAAATMAPFTSRDSAASTSGGAGRWCAVPTPETQSNVYRLADMPPRGSGSNASRMIIVPVVNNGEFGPTGTNRRLGVRLWACDSSSLTNDSWVKVTAWRRANNSGSFTWRDRQGSGFAGHRLDPAQGFGKELADLHRLGTRPHQSAPFAKQDDRSRYTWLVSSGRAKSATARAPVCANNGCDVAINGPQTAPLTTFAQGFQHDTGATRAPNNAVTYPGNGYWTGAGSFTSASAQEVRLNPYQGQQQPPFQNGRGPASFDGRQVQWVVMEWGGTTQPSRHMVIEVFLQ